MQPSSPAPSIRALCWLVVFALTAWHNSAAADADFDDSNERTRLYETPNPKSPGGIQGRVVSPAKPIQQVLAIPPDAPEEVYQGEIDPETRDSFRFTGLPMRKYDLIVIFEDEFVEGLQLHRGDSTLTGEDIAKVNDTIEKSEPFFTRKIIHRLEGDTGRGNLSRCITTFVREERSITYMDAKNAEKSTSGYYRHTYKLVLLKDVGPGWQIVRDRDLFPTWHNPQQALPRHSYHESLSGIRVADGIKDIGELNLQLDGSPTVTQEQ